MAQHAPWILLACVTMSSAALAQEKAARKPEPEVAAVSKEPKVAIVIGISEYDGPSTGFTRLDYAAKDAQEVADQLRRQGYHIVGRCTQEEQKKRPDGGGCPLTDAMARKNFIKEALDQAIDAVSDGHGTLIFFFSGHGLQKKESDPQYLALSGANLEELDANTITVDSIKTTLRKTSARRMVFIDACRDAPDSGDPNQGKSKETKSTQGFYQSSPAQPATNGLGDSFGIRILYSTQHPYASWEDPQLDGGHGRFSYYFIKGLSGEGASPNSTLITFESLYSYLHAQMMKENDKHPDKKQLISEDGNHDGNFYIAGEMKEAAASVMTQTSAARKRYVLLVGNDKYPLTPLGSAVQDMRAMHDLLAEKLGIDESSILVLADATKKQMDDAIVKFGQAVQPGSDAIFYFSGKGAMAGDEPYMIPTDYKVGAVEVPEAHRGIHSQPLGTDYEAWVGVRVKRVLDLLSVKVDVRKVMLFDMCLTSVADQAKGWAVPPASDGRTAMLFGSSPGFPAFEDKQHGFFTGSILSILTSSPPQSWAEFSGRVQAETQRLSEGKQVPFIAGYLNGPYALERK